MTQAKPRVIAEVRSADGYAGILQAFRKRQDELGLSTDKLDEIAGGDENDNRYATKWLSGSKALGRKSWGDALGGMGMMLLFVEDPAAMARLRKHIGTRNSSHVRSIARIRITRWLFTPRSARKSAKKRWSKTPKGKRAANARKAANTRWRRVREARRAARNAPAQPSPCVAR